MNLSKKDFRNKAALSIRNLSGEKRAAFNIEICRKLTSLKEVSSAENILAYFPLTDEVDIKPFLNDILKLGKNLFLPRISPGESEMSIHKVSDLSAELTEGPYSISEPAADLQTIEPEKLDVIIVPGRAFTYSGSRIGRGKGYYDRYLNNIKNIPLAAACYSCQVFEEIPVDEHDRDIDILVTENNITTC
ncbi:MAG: 5-formyltetrahydrofolate cyclo-ligase [Planctomycetota bacterium]|jgi:5-formyltetrahydrofolate cyclo-ligase